ncbi:uncharacterized protein LOC126937105 isoform X2 [Macaca thibetana thibetana]|uniref:uncharacterized protein LOC126937105 isoform X2 n=1 Tax=Macaca thibetana thibetana TaxID=257877 RepID=UPI0021BCEAD4|nr:uncharacterized protein LOC126937105 isoform X2 [Macaca thibetana thibetana]
MHWAGKAHPCRDVDPPAASVHVCHKPSQQAALAGMTYSDGWERGSGHPCLASGLRCSPGVRYRLNYSAPPAPVATRAMVGGNPVQPKAPSVGRDLALHGHGHQQRLPHGDGEVCSEGPRHLAVAHPRGPPGDRSAQTGEQQLC